MKKLFLFAVIACSSMATMAQSALPAFNDSKNPHNKTGYEFYLYVLKQVSAMKAKTITPDEVKALLTSSTYPYKGRATEKQMLAFRSAIETTTFSSKDGAKLESAVLAKPLTADSDAVLYQVALWKWGALAVETVTQSTSCYTCVEACGDRCMRKKASDLQKAPLSTRIRFLMSCGLEVLTWYADCMYDCIGDHTSH